MILNAHTIALFFFIKIPKIVPLLVAESSSRRMRMDPRETEQGGVTACFVPQKVHTG